MSFVSSTGVMLSLCCFSALTLRGIFALFLLILIGADPISSQTTLHNGSRVLVLTGVTVIDATGSPAQPDTTVVIEGDRIAAVGRSEEVTIPEGAQVVDTAGKFLIPGLVDMHVHTAWDRYFVGPLMLANGVTGAREMFAYDLPAIQRRRMDLAEGRLDGPRIQASGPLVDGPDGPWPGAITVKNATEARTAVDAIENQGYDFVKVYSSLGRETYFAIAAEAKKDEIPFAGHVPGVITASEASDAGQKSMEHLLGISLACSGREEQLRVSSGSATNTPDSYFAQEKAELDSFDDAKAAALFAQFKKNGTWQVPTLVVMRNAALYGDAEYLRALSSSPRARYLPLALKMMWKLGFRLSPKLSPENLAISRRYFRWELQVVGEMQRAGVGILVGTDTPNPYVYPGFGLQDELELLVEAGLTPMRAMQAATHNAAEYLGLLDSMGTIEEGKIADLDLLDANPLEDIRNTQRLHAVILGGRLIPKSGLEALLNRAESNRWRANPAAITLIRLVAYMMRYLLYAVLFALLTVSFGVYRFIRRAPAANAIRPELQ